MSLQNYTMNNHTKVKHMHMPVRGPLNDTSLATWYVARTGAVVYTWVPGLSTF